MGKSGIAELEVRNKQASEITTDLDYNANELQVWFLSEHLVNVPLIEANRPAS